MDAGDEEDSISRISFGQNVLFGEPMNLPNIDKVQGVIIRLRENEHLAESKNQLIAMLEALLRSEPTEVKKKRLSTEYGLEMNRDTERRLNDMCNLSEVVLERGLQQGIEQGIEQGLEQGIKAFIEDKREDNVSDDVIKKRLCKRFSITEEKAEEYLGRL
ncbi:MAG: hypothetical protein E7305_11295 [Butyrivibrio sp.]|nr:hypothetical protein [Butyrivibrio sp.]